MADIFNMDDTWNAGATTFTAIKMNVTNTASASASLLMDLQVGGTSKFAVTKAGAVKATSGSASAPGFAFLDSASTGIFNTISILEFVSAGTLTARFSGGNWFNPVSTGAVIISAAGSYNWSSSVAGTDGSDLRLFRDAANTLAQRNSTNAQSFRIYNTYTDASNHERLSIGWSGNDLYILTNEAGSGTARNMYVGTGGAASLSFRTNSVNRWIVGNTSGHFVAGVDNTYDIGASGATRPRSVYTGTSVFTADTGTIGFEASNRFTSPSNGVMLLAQSGGGFNRLQIGGTTSAFPAIKCSTTSLQARLADDSAFTNIQGKLTTDTNYAAGAIVATGYLTLYDATGTAYQVPCVAA